MQAEYDNILREAKLLRMDLQHALTKCLEHRVPTMHCCIGFMHALTDCAYSAFEYCTYLSPCPPNHPHFLSLYQRRHEIKIRTTDLQALVQSI